MCTQLAQDTRCFVVQLPQAELLLMPHGDGKHLQVGPRGERGGVGRSVEGSGGVVA